MNDNALNNLTSRMKDDFYVGVVGSVRSGKSSFINKFFELKVLPYLNDEFIKNKIVDELPQTADGKQIMTVEPKFIPSTSLNINVKEDWNFNIRIVDCVGQIIPSATGYSTEDGPRLVKTPWFDDKIPFEDAAKIGTEKVIKNHSNLGIYITSDGSFGEFSRAEYKKVEEDLIPQLMSLEKPFTIVLNTKNPTGKLAQSIKLELEEKYKVVVNALNVIQMTQAEIDQVLSSALGEFPIEDLEIALPEYFAVLGDDIELKKLVDDEISNASNNYNKIKDIAKIQDYLKNTNLFKDVKLDVFSPTDAKVIIEIELKEETYQTILEELLGDKGDSRSAYISYLYECKKLSKTYENLGSALEMAKETGYGISVPQAADMKLLPPQIVKQNGKYGVKLSAIAPSIHLIKVDVESSFTPIIGSEAQSQMMMDNLLNEDIENSEVWNKEFFGRKLSEIVNDGIRAKIYQMPDKSKDKLKNVLDKMINSSHNGLIAIIV